MTHVMLERDFDTPLTPQVLREMGDRTDCLPLYRVVWHGSFLSGDSRRLLCWFTAPDAESARVALRHSGARTGVVWHGDMHDGPAPGNGNVVVERRFDDPVTQESVQEIEDAGAWCLESYRVEFVRTFFSRDRRRMLCFYAAPDAESVRAAQRQAGMPHEAVWAFRFMAPVVPRAVPGS